MMYLIVVYLAIILATRLIDPPIVHLSEQLFITNINFECHHTPFSECELLMSNMLRNHQFLKSCHNKGFMQYLILILLANANDIEINPGPTNISRQYQCGTCDETVDWEQKVSFVKLVISGTMPTVKMSTPSVMKPFTIQIQVGIVLFAIPRTIAAQCTIYTPPSGPITNTIVIAVIYMPHLAKVYMYILTYRLHLRIHHGNPYMHLHQ